MSGYLYPEERDELIAELEFERTYSATLARDSDNMTKRLNRLEEHLRNGKVLREMLNKLADYAGSVAHEEIDNPIPDPFPDPEPPAKPKRARRAKA